jgi:hypothetical protein
VRFEQKLELPEGMKAKIGQLRVVPAQYRPARPTRHKREYTPLDKPNWRSSILADIVRKVRETTDPQYDEMFGIFNKIATQNMAKLSQDAITILVSRDEEFRLRVTALLFDKAIRGSAYASVMADLALILNTKIPEVSEDLATHVQMFGTLYDMKETLTFPKVDESGFADKVIEWSKQKDVRRGYARFLTNLYSRELESGQA